MTLRVGGREVYKGCKAILRNCSISKVNSVDCSWNSYEVAIQGETNRYYDENGVCTGEPHASMYDPWLMQDDDLNSVATPDYRDYDIVGVLYRGLYE